MTDETLRRVLRADPFWSLSALGHLAPARRRYCRWLIHPNERGVILLYSEFGTPILFAAGEPDDIADLVGQHRLPDSVYLHIPPRLLAPLQAHYPQTRSKPMVRMAFTGELTPVDCSPATPLGPADLSELEALYADGASSGESPDFFFAQMLEDGAFHGIRIDGRLVAAAGTHIVYEEESIAAIGNVYTHREYRRRGLARVATAAAVRSLRSRGIATIGLNVVGGNPARFVYESLGFVVHCEFVEGPASTGPR